MLNHSTGWVRVRPQDPIIVACTSPCGQVEWGVIPSNAIQNITVLSRTDERCNSVTGTCINDFSEPCPAAENEFMKFTLKLRTTVTLIIQCNAYIIFATDLTTRHMMRGDSFLIMVENKEDICELFARHTECDTHIQHCSTCMYRCARLIGIKYFELV